MVQEFDRGTRGRFLRKVVPRHGGGGGGEYSTTKVAFVVALITGTESNLLQTNALLADSLAWTTRTLPTIIIHAHRMRPGAVFEKWSNGRACPALSLSKRMKVCSVMK